MIKKQNFVVKSDEYFKNIFYEEEGLLNVLLNQRLSSDVWVCLPLVLVKICSLTQRSDWITLKACNTNSIINIPNKTAAL